MRDKICPKLKDVIDELVTANRILANDRPDLMGRVKFLSKGEVDAVIARTGPYTLDRAWEAFARRAGRRIKEPR